jgi:hypothetical protein
MTIGVVSQGRKFVIRKGVGVVAFGQDRVVKRREGSQDMKQVCLPQQRICLLARASPSTDHKRKKEIVRGSDVIAYRIRGEVNVWVGFTNDVSGTGGTVAELPCI